jgi:CubicO group peptidase (beta-lactamase class C family)
MRTSAGTEFKYKDADPHILSAIIQEAAGKTTRDWAQEVLFNKIGISRLEWNIYRDGVTMGGNGIKTTPRELGKIGQLILDDGIRAGEQIVSKDWIDGMTSAKCETHNKDLSFGYLWWKDIVRNVSHMWGRGGQFVFINREKKLIVVITSEQTISGDFEIHAHEGLLIYDMINSITQ